MCGNPQGGGSTCHFHWREGLELICGECANILSLLLSLPYYHVTIMGHTEGREAIPSITVAMIGLSLCAYV